MIDHLCNSFKVNLEVCLEASLVIKSFKLKCTFYNNNRFIYIVNDPVVVFVIFLYTMSFTLLEIKEVILINSLLTRNRNASFPFSFIMQKVMKVTCAETHQYLFEFSIFGNLY